MCTCRLQTAVTIPGLLSISLFFSKIKTERAKNNCVCLLFKTDSNRNEINKISFQNEAHLSFKWIGVWVELNLLHRLRFKQAHISECLLFFFFVAIKSTTEFHSLRIEAWKSRLNLKFVNKVRSVQAAQLDQAICSQRQLLAPCQLHLQTSNWTNERKKNVYSIWF